MKINNISNREYHRQHFGHSFRVSISLKNTNGCEDIFINPYTNRKLYRQLNSKIIGWLNEEYRESIRNVFNIKRKIPNIRPLRGMQERLVYELKRLDSDYKFFGYARSLYRSNKLGYIITGVDASIVENVKGIRDIGMARAQETWGNNTNRYNFTPGIAKLAKRESLEYATDSNVLLRSGNNREIMLRVLFEETGKHKNGLPVYEIHSFEFHENKGKPALPPVSEGFEQNKYSQQMMEKIKQTIQSHATQMAGENIYLNHIDEFVRQH